MRGAVMTKPVRIEVRRDLPEPEVGPGNVLVEVAEVAICKSELDRYTGAMHLPEPLRFGHEVVGTVVKIGPEVSTIAVGDRVVPYVELMHGCDDLIAVPEDIVIRLHASWADMAPGDEDFLVRWTWKDGRRADIPVIAQKSDDRRLLPGVRLGLPPRRTRRDRGGRALPGLARRRCARETTPVRWQTGTSWASRPDYSVSLAPHEMRVIRVVSPPPRRAHV